MFDFIYQQQLQPHHFEQKIEWLIDGVIAKGLITLIYADGGNGKSWLAAGISKYAATQGMSIVYLDYDTPLQSLAERGINEKLVYTSDRVHFVSRGTATMRPEVFLDALEEKAVSGTYKNTLIVFDSLRNFADINNNARAMQALDQIMNLREAGATVLIISHANKDGRNYQGSNNIRNSIDNMYRLTKVESPSRCIMRFMLNVEKERVQIGDAAFELDTADLTLSPIDLSIVQMSAEDKAFVNEVKVILTKQPGINKTDLLAELGYNKDDKTARNRLDQYEDLFWVCEKQGKAYTYRLP
ncbi:MAG: AAA family ATPase [Thiomicrospira sp.]